MNNFRITLTRTKFIMDEDFNNIVKTEELPSDEGKITVDTDGNFRGYLKTKLASKTKKSYIIGVCDIESQIMTFIQFFNPLFNEKTEKPPFPMRYWFDKFNVCEGGVWDHYNYLYGACSNYFGTGDFYAGNAKIDLLEVEDFQLSKEDDQIIQRIVSENPRLMNLLSLRCFMYKTDE